VETPDECFLCGPEEEIINPDAILSELDGLTCEGGAEFARRVFNETVCERGAVKQNVDHCCRPKSANQLAS
jgi:hypothetical protein